MSDPRGEVWLPDLCRMHRVAAMLGMAELVVVVLALAPSAEAGWTLAQFLYASGLALWTALAVTGALCVSRRTLSDLPQALGSVAAVSLAGVIAWICAGIVHGLYSVMGEMPGGIAPAGFWRFSLGCAAMVALISALALRHFYVSDRWSAQVLAHAQAQADALQARIRPHFLFNSMNLIAGLVRRDADVAERAVLDLSDLFRAALVAGETSSTLRGEIELAQRYLSIESLRLGERLQVEWQLDESLPWTLPMPQLVLQPLVENAVLHGISKLPEGGVIELSVHREAGALRLLIRNPAPEPGTAHLPLGNGAGHACRNIAHRLGYRFGPAARMTGGWSDGYYECAITLPLNEVSS